VDYPAIGVGGSFQYYLAGGHMNLPSARLAISALRRRVGVGQLKAWLDKASSTLGPHHPEQKNLDYLKKHLHLLSNLDSAREQVANFYKSWFDLLASTPRAGRSLALFQDLSSAYALGRSLSEFPDENATRRPESVVEPLMLSCL
jgi:hypothetical protein